MNKHTPGPWIAKHSSGAGLGVWADLRPALGDKYSKDFPIIGVDSLPAPKVQIAYEQWVQFPSNEWNEMQAANVKLMAASPELLASLQAAVAMLDAPILKEVFGIEWYEQASAAIAKATGQ